MEFTELFSRFWWLLFPLIFFISAGWNSFMSYKRTKAKVELLKTYAQSGNTPPPELIAALDKDEQHSRHGTSGGDADDMAAWTPFLVVLFAGLSAVFAFVGYQEWLGDANSMYFVAMILGVLAIAFLFSSLFGGRRRK
ncbi:hypothetical protein V0U79_00070 [Hyphobacterium sp. HN65]|uniref:Uncharacterized protein n=1 Tax=Hyphobacterium lacteum TaxID=3116575 RepID=A0ABU7LLD3_9PROT|nr:hypothetical protein [Hyphobacterium sp. HN65]MEE2524745.1 hypothetical protein [Hyphobacterium sp. HN65]